MKPPFSEEILTVLYVLFRAEAALRAEDIIDTLEDTSIDYFTAHQILEHLLENKTVFSVKQNGYELYFISPIGKDAIEQFYPTVRASVRNSIDSYLKDNLAEMTAAAGIRSSVCFSFDGNYCVILKLFENNLCAMEITLTVRDSATAELFMQNWSKSSQDIYTAVLRTLSQSTVT